MIKYPKITNCQLEALLERYNDGKLDGTGYHFTKGQITNGLIKKGYLKLVNGSRKLTPLAIAYIESLN